MIYDAIIVGSGPGGAVAAATLAKRGKSVLLVDRQSFPRDKVCGDGMPGNVMRLLDKDLGIDIHKARLNHQQIYGLVIGAPSGREVVIPERPSTQYSMVSPRLYFDNMLHEHALKSGAKFEVMHIDGPLFSEGDEKTRKVIGVIERKGKEKVEHEAKVVIAADGASSPMVTSLRGRVSDPRETAVAIRAYAHLKKPLPGDPMVYFKYLTSLIPGYGWVFPAGPGRINIGLGMFDQEVYKKAGKSLKVLLNEFMAAVEDVFPVELEQETVKSWPIPCWMTNESRVVNGAFLVGDAGRFVDALTGGGIFSAMVTGHVAAHAAANQLEGKPHAEAALEYDTNWRSGIGVSLRKLLMVQNLIASKPLLFNSVVGLAARVPPIKGTLIKSLAGQHA
jgi:menaquinone-9 beta-reductase